MTEYVLPVVTHNRLVEKTFTKRGFSEDECSAAARLCALASWHGIRTHNAIKALHLDDLFGSGNADKPGCVPNARIEKLSTRFTAADKWNANRKLGQATAFEALDQCIDMAEQHGVGIISVDNAFHYLWGGGYVMEAAKRGYLAYTNCTAALAEVVPFMGTFATLGTNPHSWAFPTTDAVGFPIVIDWATSAVAMGKVQQLKREGKPIPQNAAVDSEGKPTTDPEKVAALVPFGAHKGYGMSLINELISAFIGGSLPTLRSRPDQARDAEEKTTPTFFFQVIHPDALDCGAFAFGRDQASNIKVVIDDILGHGNEHCLLPGQIEHEAARRSERAGGVIITESELAEFREMAQAVGEQFDVEPVDET